MLSDRDRLVLDEIDRELTRDDPRLATVFTEWRPRETTWWAHLHVALLTIGGLLMVLGVLFVLPVMFWAGVVVLGVTGGTRRWWPHRRT